TEHARVRVRSVDLERCVVDAEHSGYSRLSQPVVHRRWLIAPPDRGSILVVDLIAGRGRHEVRTSWPLSPSLDVTPLEGGHLASRDGEPILQLVHSASSELIRYEVRGDAQLGLGWWSRRLESREPAWLVGGYCTGDVPVVVASVLNPLDERMAWAEDLTVGVRDGCLIASWREGSAENRVDRVPAPGPDPGVRGADRPTDRGGGGIRPAHRQRRPGRRRRRERRHDRLCRHPVRAGGRPGHPLSRACDRRDRRRAGDQGQLPRRRLSQHHGAGYLRGDTHPASGTCLGQACGCGLRRLRQPGVPA
ncbi:MAG: hypothetical protein EOP26_14635, partial [Rhodococcus sp. (in: high G+C Gram-positive bacteria)]